MKTIRELVNGAPNWIEFNVRLGDALPFSGNSEEILEKINTLGYEPHAYKVEMITVNEVHIFGE